MLVENGFNLLSVAIKKTHYENNNTISINSNTNKIHTTFEDIYGINNNLDC